MYMNIFRRPTDSRLVKNGQCDWRHDCQYAVHLHSRKQHGLMRCFFMHERYQRQPLRFAIHIAKPRALFLSVLASIQGKLPRYSVHPCNDGFKLDCVDPNTILVSYLSAVFFHESGVRFLRLKRWSWIDWWHIDHDWSTTRLLESWDHISKVGIHNLSKSLQAWFSSMVSFCSSGGHYSCRF